MDKALMIKCYGTTNLERLMFVRMLEMIEMNDLELTVDFSKISETNEEASEFATEFKSIWESNKKYVKMGRLLNEGKITELQRDVVEYFEAEPEEPKPTDGIKIEY